MERITSEIILGKNLSNEYIEFMTTARISQYGENSKNFRENEQDSIFFFIKLGLNIVSFGMLKPIIIRYNERNYEILGIGAVLSITKNSGYGKLLMTEILKYLKLKGKSGLGFCDKKNSEFYKKSGFKILSDLALRFRYIYATPEEELVELNQGGDGICYNGLDDFILVVDSSSSLGYFDIPFW
jgi:predicted N-acetyltransferase YhbS